AAPLLGSGARGSLIDVGIGHVHRKLTVDQVELRLAMEAAQLKAVVASEGTISEYGFGVLMARAIVPNGRLLIVADEPAILGVGPAARAVKIHAALHGAVLEVIRAGFGVPGAHGVAAQRPEGAVPHDEPGSTGQ